MKLIPCAIAAAAVASLAACGAASSSSSSAAAPASSPAAAAAAASSPSCASQVTAWASAGGSSSLTSLGNDAGTLGTGMQALAADEQAGTDASADTSAVQSSAASLQSDAQAIQASPGPSCVPGMATDLSAAAKDFDTAAIDATNAVNQMTAGGISAATGDLTSAIAAEDAGNGKLEAANTAVKNFSATS